MADQRASSAAHALQPVERAGGIELPVDVLRLVLLPLKDDMASLCAAACVARAWRQAATWPRLWSRIGRFRGNAAANLTNARLKQIVSRARRGLRHLDLRGLSSKTSNLTDKGLAEALRRQKRILSFRANGGLLTGAGIAAALVPSSGRLRKLLVCGVRALPRSASTGSMSSAQQEAFLDACLDSALALRDLLAPDGYLNATAVCDAVMDGNVLCTRMCDETSVCWCEAVYCKCHAGCIFECEGCDNTVCERCCSFSSEICNDCYLIGSDKSGFSSENEL